MEKDHIDKFMKRKRMVEEGHDILLSEILKEILYKANEFVPSEAGSILLDDPENKKMDLKENKLCFVACFGEKSSLLIGRTILATEGIAGRTYILGRSYISRNVDKDIFFYRDMDKTIGVKTRSIITVPIVIGKAICGVIELLNRKEKISYTINDLRLLEIFAGYTSTLIQNALDGKVHRELVKRDYLTGLYNEKFFNHKLGEEIERIKESKEDIAIFFIDIDHFKYINDNYGHIVGSKILQEIGSLLSSTIKTESSIIARYGGDEFIIAIPGIKKENAFLIGEKIKSNIETFVFFNNIKNIISCSIGIAHYKVNINEKRSIEEIKLSLIKEADQSMYIAKETGRARVFMKNDIT